MTTKIPLSTLVGQPAAVLLERAAELPNLADPATADRLRAWDAAVKRSAAKYWPMGLQVQTVTQDLQSLAKIDPASE